jgi:hypothetical protein
MNSLGHKPKTRNGITHHTHICTQIYMSERHPAFTEYTTHNMTHSPSATARPRTLIISAFLSSGLSWSKFCSSDASGGNCLSVVP